jgi:septal ring factor EnvC (AmiA/AmiB activator)
MSHRITPPWQRWPRLVGLTLIVTAALGFLLSIAGLLFVARAGATAQQAAADQLATLDRALATTAEGLAIADTSLAEAGGTLTSLSATIADARRAIGEIEPSVGALRELTGTTLPESIASTRRALASARETARVADQVLGALSLIGLSYNPEVPLNEAIAEVSEGLADVPGDLAAVSAGLDTSEESLSGLAADLGEVSAGLDAIGANVSQAALVVDQYQEIVAGLQADVAATARAAPGWITATRWALALGLIWLGLSQIALLIQGWGMLEQARASERAD